VSARKASDGERGARPDEALQSRSYYTRRRGFDDARLGDDAAAM